MTPPNQTRRIGLIALFGVVLIAGVFLLLSALSENTQFFYNPSDVIAQGFVPESETFRIGGLVAEGSVVKEEGLKTTFWLKDFEREMSTPIIVTHIGVLPDLFREGQGVVVTGSLMGKTQFEAIEVLAKHDENYQPDINYQDEKS